MLEFNLDGDLFTGFDASNAYQRVAGGDPSAYGLSQQKNLQPGSASDPLSAQDPISALADDDQNQQAATLKPHRPALWNQGTPSQHHTSQPAGVATGACEHTGAVAACFYGCRQQPCRPCTRGVRTRAHGMQRAQSGDFGSQLARFGAGPLRPIAKE